MASLPLFFLGFLVLGEDLSWAQEHPHPCDETPWPGVQCEIGDENPPIFHVTKIHIGPDTRTPPCKSSASLSSSLLKLPYLKNCALSLDNSRLNGIVPTSLGTLPSLDRLNLSNNQLSGALSLPEDFIERLGKKLDVRGNNGLCAINPLYKKKKGTSANLISTPLCLNASEATNDTALAGEEEEPNVSERMKPFGQYPVENNSSGFLCVK
ncbi:hypothetical protein C1H46_031929 [Malus baccata]|uniref:Leucine-rich repeat-containing N-terminal plant-type domain-containing protein n=1 Tax=Malus baccata TaxID=106549 RepID=A0A540L7N1_MALBA|nr:hypothetical protein C1H46_031929 [Malus baccata]